MDDIFKDLDLLTTNHAAIGMKVGHLIECLKKLPEEGPVFVRINDVILTEEGSVQENSVWGIDVRLRRISK